MSDSLSHFFSHLKNAQKSRILVIEHAQSKVILSVVQALQECGYIRGYRLVTNPNCDSLLCRSSASRSTSPLQAEQPKEYLAEKTLGQSHYPLKGPKGEETKKFTQKIEILLKYKNQKPAINQIIRI